ncbi:MAG: hypothetical protein QM831_27315 [Kofleriaceae bacterium]
MKWFVIVALVACSSKKTEAPPPAPAPAPTPVAAPVVDAGELVDAMGSGVGANVPVPPPGHSRVMPDKIKQAQRKPCPACDFACTRPGERPIEKPDENGCRQCGCEKDPSFPK